MVKNAKDWGGGERSEDEEKMVPVGIFIKMAVVSMLAWMLLNGR